MNKLLLLSGIKDLLFVVKSSTEYNIGFVCCKMDSQTKFLLQTQNVCLNDLELLVQAYYFLCSQKSEIFLDQGTFPQSRNFSTVKEFFPSQRTSYGQGNLHGQETFLQSWKLSTLKELFLNQGTFQQSWKFSTKFFEKKKMIKEISHKQEKFSAKKKFSFIKEVFHKQTFLHSQENFLQTKIKKNVTFFSTQDSKRFHTPKIINTFHDTSFFYTP